MNDTALSLAAIALLVTSSTTGALAASTIAVNHGSSMQPTLCDGSVVVVDRSATAKLGDVVSFKRDDGRTLHRLVRYAPDWDAGPDGEPVRDDGRDLVLLGDNNGDDVDVSQVWHDPYRVDYTDTEDVVGVVSHVVYDGCGPL